MAKVKPIKLNTKVVKLVVNDNPTLGVKPLTEEEARKHEEARKRFIEKVNAHRPYCSADFKKQHFIPDLSNIR